MFVPSKGMVVPSTSYTSPTSGPLREFALPGAILYLGALCRRNFQTTRPKTGGQYSKALKMPLNWTRC